MQVTPSSATLGTGALIAGRYRLGELLGSGGMAFVYDGVDTRLQRLVAVKLLRPEMFVRDDIRVRFEAEARAAAGFSHPNAVAVFDTGEHDGVPYLIMERLPGQTLADRLATRPVDAAWLRQAANGVLGALAAAHAGGIVHRDVKPGNILLTAEGTAKISDFGIAKSLPEAAGEDGRRADLTHTGQLLGTPAYLAPERLVGKPATARSDLFALGVVLYEAFAGRKPFVGDSPLAVARAVSDGDHIPLGTVRPDLDPQFVATIERALARDPEDRFATAEEMAASLQGRATDTTVDAAAADGTMILDLPPDTVTRPQAMPRPRRGRFPLAGLVAAGLAIFLVIALIAIASTDKPSLRTAAGEAAGETATTVTSPPTTAAATPAGALADGLRSLASGLRPTADGARAADLAAGLRRVADAVAAGGGATEATALIVSAAQWLQSGQLAPATALSALDLLRQVPGAGQAAASGPQLPAPTSPPSVGGNSSSSSSSSDGRAKGKDKDDEDD